MKLGDLFTKLARGENLTPQEQSQIKLIGNQVEINNSYISGIQQGRSIVNADDLFANRIYVGREIFSGLAARYACFSLSVANATYVDSTGWSKDYADPGFYINGNGIVIPETGRYIVAFQVSWDNSPASTGLRDTGAKTNGNPARPQSNATATAGAYTYVRAYDEIEYSKDDVITFTHWQDSGVYASLDMWVVFRKIR